MNRRQKLQLSGLFVVSATLTTLVMAQSITVSTVSKVKLAPTHDPYVRYGPPAPGRPVDLVICLDTSGSMTGLINSARAKLWDIVNELVSIEPNARLRVGLLTYGSPNHSSYAQGWIVRQTDLTNDLDTVYARMMSMSTNGGDEFVGWVLNDAVYSMSWSRDPRALRLIYVAGNESADQCSSRFNFRQIAREARRRGIVVNAIYAGPNSNGISEHWDQVARHGGGDFFAINQDAGTVQIHTPQDKVLIELNAKLNATYVPYGRDGRVGVANQEAQDKNAMAFGEQSLASRAGAKASGVYQNARWDLVDAAAAPDFKLENVKEEALPAEMKKMTVGERRQYVVHKRKARAEVQRKIREVSQKREGFLRTVRKKKTGQIGLDDAIRKSIRRQATRKAGG